MVGYQSLTSGVCVSQAQGLLSAQDPGLVASLLEVLVVLWRSVQRALDHNQEAQRYTVAKFSSVMSKYFNTFEVRPVARRRPPVVRRGITTTRTTKMTEDVTPVVEMKRHSRLIDCKYNN